MLAFEVFLAATPLNLSIGRRVLPVRMLAGND